MLGETKESIPERLKLLIGDRSARAAARDWGLSFSTLNNYLTRGTEPSLSVALQIAAIEGVSVEWLCGLDVPANTESCDLKANHIENGKVIMAIINALDAKDVEQLSKQLALNGARYLSQLLNAENQSLLRLEGRKRMAALMLEDMSDERVREILAEIENDKQAADVVNVKAG